jgi:hypothetical protein
VVLVALLQITSLLDFVLVNVISVAVVLTSLLVDVLVLKTPMAAATSLLDYVLASATLLVATTSLLVDMLVD